VLTCPRCRITLNRIQGAGSNYWECPTCGGHAMNLALVRRRSDHAAISRLWQATHSPGLPTLLPCPACFKKMIEVQFVHETRAFPVDVCQRCQFLWFDSGELQSIPKYTPPPPKKQLPQEAREALALYQVEQIRDRADAASARDLPDEGWQVMVGMLGMPVEQDDPGLQRHPLATWTIGLLIVLVSLTIFALGDEALDSLAFIPADPWRHAGITWLTSFFVHGGLMHLFGNLYFLLVFGDNVEDLIGRKRFLAVLFLGALAGDIFHALAEPRSALPTIGASGGISGIIALYALAFPHARLGLFMRYTWVNFSARTGFVIWVAFQILGMLRQLHGSGSVSSLAHLGGCLIGVFFWLWHCRMRRTDAP
jgi:membrane associated rhomboid family serine protease/Zn-finger nucleic acid-binding protein